MSRPKTVRSRTKSKTPHSEAKIPVEPTPAAKSAAPESTPDQNASKEHRAESGKGSPEDEKPWSEWLWSEEGQMCYRGRKDSKGEWEYEFAKLEPLLKERPYTPPREQPIEYLIDELKLIWEPRLIDVPGANAVTAAPASGNEPSKDAGENLSKVKKAGEEEKEVEGKEDKKSKVVDTDSTVSEEEKLSEKPKKERHPIRRGRQLERPVRKQPSHKERKEKVEGWRNEVE